MDFENENSTASLPTSDTWELDFSSRPILDSRGKKRWELLICSPDRSWIYSKWFPNNKINSTQVSCLSVPASDKLTPVVKRFSSVSCDEGISAHVGHAECGWWCLQLKAALADIISQEGAQAPQRVRFFRGQMQTIISRALTDLDIKPVPSRRCFALIGEPCRHAASISWEAGSRFPAQSGLSNIAATCVSAADHRRHFAYFERTLKTMVKIKFLDGRVLRRLLKTQASLVQAC